MSTQEEDGERLISKIKNIRININDFGYDKILIKEACIEMTKGDVIGLMGKSGSGKSTIMKMLLKYIRVEGIFINSIPVAELSNANLRTHIAYVSQDTYLFPCSIIDNITLGKVFPDDVINSVLNMPFLSKFKSLPDGFDTVVVENGSNLSGGDKQRIVIARALLKQADVYIFDESFSALDEQTALSLQREIIELHKNKILIFIAHNMKLMNQIENKYIMENGSLRKL